MREDAAFAVDRRAYPMQLLARLIGGDQVLAPVLDPFHRPAQPHGGDADQHVLGIELAADAEAAADMGLVHVDRRRREREHAREQIAIAVRHLGGAVQFENVAGRVIATDCATGLERHAGMAADRKLELDHQRRGAQHRVDIAVALANDRHLGVASGGELAGLGLGGEQDRQLLDRHGDEIGGVLRHIGVVREHGGDRLADVTHLVGRQHRLAEGVERGNASLAEVDRRYVRDVGRGPDRGHAGQGARGGRIDRDDPAVGVVRANDAHVELVRKGNVGGEAAAAPHQRRVFKACNRLPDPLVVGALVALRHRRPPGAALILAAAARTAFTMFS